MLENIEPFSELPIEPFKQVYTEYGTVHAKT